MKVLTPEDIAGHRAATTKGAIRGILLGAAISAPTFYTLQRRSHFYKQLPLPLKAFGVVVVVVPCFSISAEKAGEAYEREQWTGVGKQELDAKAQAALDRWSSLDTWGKVKDWSKSNKWGLIGTSWASVMAGSFYLVNRNNAQSFAQKLVQARVYAQAWTVVLMLAVAFTSGYSTDEEVPQLKNTDHSWREILEQEGYMKPEQKQKEPLKTPSEK
ncbi:hypothetical protein BCR39DRAFT_508208 [Naematelia encephala]|uniref:HIG1 domain-containing protein n=1 Tax=Naematelia encephala TaxID=71784 RepID=A0A1Y2AHQ6_9TREE|nr:hypothetical protein BCR39DRAFT_508208 [Naematelia encephala]